MDKAQGAIAAPVVAAVGIAVLASVYLGGSPKPSSQPINPAERAQPSVAANGEIWARVGGGDGPSFVYGVEPDGSGKTLLFSDGRDPNSPPETVNAEAVGQDYAWSPDGSRVAFSGSSNPDQHAAYRAIFVMNADGSGLIQLTPDSEVDSGPAWSPDGTRIAYASDRTGPFSDASGCEETPLCPGDIHVMNADGTGDVQLTDDPADDSQPFWSPGATRIAFDSGRDDPHGDVFVMNADGTGLAQLTSGAAFDGSPLWSPDGTRIAFERVEDGAAGIFDMRPDGTEVAELVHTGMDPAAGLVWAPDGTKVAWSDGTAIHIVASDGTGDTPIADFTPYVAGDLAWRPTG